MSDTPHATDISLEQLHADLQAHLKTVPTDATRRKRYRIQEGLSSLLHTPFAGPVEVSDYFSAIGPRHPQTNEVEAPPDPDQTLYAGSAILSIACGGELRQIANGEVKDGIWYLLGRRGDIAPRSIHEVIFNAAVRSAEQAGETVPSIPPTDVIAFNMEELVLDAVRNDCLRGLAEGLAKLR